jgi:hypothetical protein
MKARCVPRETCVLVGSYAAYSHNYVPTFRDKLPALSSTRNPRLGLLVGFLLGLLDLRKWDREVVPKRRYGIAALRCVKRIRTQISFTSRRKPEVTYMLRD